MWGTTRWLGAGISPFLLLDYAGPAEFSPSEAPRGVGEHPHRGFETVTIVYQGEVEHRDSGGNAGRIGPGDVQWMTAASGTASAQGSTPLHFVVDTGSQVKTVVREQLTVAPVPSNAVSIAPGITGDLYLTKDGLASAQKSTFTVDLMSLKSDEALRDRAMRGSLSSRVTMRPLRSPLASSSQGRPVSCYPAAEAPARATQTRSSASPTPTARPSKRSARECYLT